MFFSKKSKVDADEDIKIFGESNKSNRKVAEFRTIKTNSVGNSAVGKTCAICTFCNVDRFPVDFVPRVFMNYAASFRLGNDIVSFSPWDTASDDNYDRLRPLAYPETSVFILCYNLVDRKSLNDIVLKWFPEVNKTIQSSPLPTPIVLLGLKHDLIDNKRIKRKFECMGESNITKYEIYEVCKKINCVMNFEVSALKDFAHLKDMWTKIIEVGFNYHKDLVNLNKKKKILNIFKKKNVKEKCSLRVNYEKMIEIERKKVLKHANDEISKLYHCKNEDTSFSILPRDVIVFLLNEFVLFDCTKMKEFSKVNLIHKFHKELEVNVRDGKRIGYEYYGYFKDDLGEGRKVYQFFYCFKVCSNEQINSIPKYRKSLSFPVFDENIFMYNKNCEIIFENYYKKEENNVFIKSIMNLPLSSLTKSKFIHKLSLYSTNINKEQILLSFNHSEISLNDIVNAKTKEELLNVFKKIEHISFQDVYFTDKNPRFEVFDQICVVFCNVKTISFYKQYLEKVDFNFFATKIKKVEKFSKDKFLLPIKLGNGVLTLKNLEHLSLYNSCYLSFRGICKNLKSLSIVNCDFVKKIDEKLYNEICKLEKVEKMFFENISFEEIIEKNLSKLFNLQNLHELKLVRCKIHPMKSLKNVKIYNINLKLLFFKAHYDLKQIKLKENRNELKFPKEFIEELNKNKELKYSLNEIGNKTICN